MRVKEELANLKKADIYSLILFALFRLRDIPEYSTLSQLSFVLDQDSLLKLCEYFGGLTIKIPTIEELESIVYSLVLYQYVNLDNMSYDDAIKLIGPESSELRKIKSDYWKLCKILDNYNFNNEE